MVFCNPAKLKGSAKPPAAGTGVRTCPDEILLEIMALLPTADILKLRLTCRAFAPTGTTVVKERLKRLYLHPSTTSLRRAVELCAHPVFSQDIEELVLLGDYSDREASEPALDENMLRPWSPSFPESKKKPLRAGEPETVDPQFFGAAYAPLLDALASLPKLSALRFTTAAKKLPPGFNMHPRQHILSFARNPAIRGQWDSAHPRWSDALFVVALLSSGYLTFTKLAMKASLITTNEFLREIGYRQTFHPAVPGPQPRSRLTSMDLVFPLRDSTAERSSVWPTYCSWLLFVNASSLVRLRITFTTSASAPSPPPEQHGLYTLLFSIITITDSATNTRQKWPKLTDLTLRMTPSAALNRPLRPTHQHVGRSHSLAALIESDMPSLSTLNIENVIDTGNPRSLDNLVLTRNTVARLRQQGRDLRLRLIVNRYRHHPICPAADADGAGLGCKLGCGYYTDAGQRSVTVGHVEFLAGRLGVGLDEGGQWWDFGGGLSEGGAAAE